MTDTPGIMQQLKEKTWDLHQEAEGQPLEQNLVRGQLPAPIYVSYLEQRLLMMRALEKFAGPVIGADPRLKDLGCEKFFLAPQAEEDIRFFGASPDAVQPLESTSRFVSKMEQLSRETPLALVGIFYVFAGSSNGARFIARAVQRGYQLQPGKGTAFLDPFGEEQRAIWGNFKALMDQIAFTDVEKEQIITGARFAFASVMEIDRQTYQQTVASAE